MPTVALTISYMKVSQYLAAADVAKGALFGGKIDPKLPIILYVERKGLETIYAKNTAYTDIQAVADYCYALCFPYGAKAISIVAGGGGGSTGGTTPTQSYPIYITQANFTTATFYPNTNIFGSNVLIFWNEVNRYLLPSEFTISSTGITITASGFDATSGFDVNLVIEKVYT